MKHEIRPCVVGLGKLGLPLASVIADTGLDVIGIDLNASHVENLNEGGFSSPEPELEDYLVRNQARLTFSNKFVSAIDRNIFFVIVPTPSLPNGYFDDTFLLDAIREISRIKINTDEITIVVVSTVMPGTCKEKVLPIIHDWQSRSINLKVNLIYSPEFIALGSVIKNLRNPDMTLVGRELGDDPALFLKVTERVTKDPKEIELLTLTEAEIVKILVNCFVTMKISFANFIGEITTTIPGMDSQKMARALGMDSRIGSKYLRPGLGFAGPCFPRDNKALISFSNDMGLSADLALATDQINDRQPFNILNQITRRIGPSGKVGVFGVAYKPFTTVVEQSQTLKISSLLAEKAYSVKLYDPEVTVSNTENKLIQPVRNPEELLDCKVIVVPKEFQMLLPLKLSDSPNLLVI
jgi:UDPglucose 6-dehydrogenase